MKRKKKDKNSQKILAYIMLFMFALLPLSRAIAACAPKPIATPVPTVQLQESGATPAPAMSLPVATPAAAASQAAVESAIRALAQELGIQSSTVSVVSATPVAWPDICLGVEPQGESCAQQVVAGYRVLLAADSIQYEVRTGEDGAKIVLAPMMAVSMQADGECRSIILHEDGALRQGPCDGEQLAISLSGDTPSAPADFVHLTRTFAPFVAETAAGTVRFVGIGQEQTTPAQQRMIAEWLRWVTDAAVAGRTSAAASLAIAWHRESGVAGFCADLSVYTYGVAVATTCRHQQTSKQWHNWLTADQLAQIYPWVDQLAGFELEEKAPSAADFITTLLVFDGTGTLQPNEDQKESMLNFASALYDQTMVTDQGILDVPSTVGAFLAALQEDPSGERGRAYLSTALLAEVEAGRSLSDIVGIQNPFRSFSVNTLNDGSSGGRAIVEAGLNYASPIHVVFYLMKENGRWRISTVSQHQLASPSADAPILYAADTVILDYFADLQNGRAADAYALLSPSYQEQIGEEDLSAVPAQPVVTTLQPVTATPERLVYQTFLYGQPQNNENTVWQQGDNERWIELTNTPDGWRINQIATSSI